MTFLDTLFYVYSKGFLWISLFNVQLSNAKKQNWEIEALLSINVHEGINVDNFWICFYFNVVLLFVVFFPAGNAEGRGKVDAWQHTYYSDSGIQSGANTVREDEGRDYSYSVTTTTVTTEHPEGMPQDMQYNHIRVFNLISSVLQASTAPPLRSHMRVTV